MLQGPLRVGPPRAMNVQRTCRAGNLKSAFRFVTQAISRQIDESAESFSELQQSCSAIFSAEWSPVRNMKPAVEKLLFFSCLSRSEITLLLQQPCGIDPLSQPRPSYPKQKRVSEDRKRVWNTAISSWRPLVNATTYQVWETAPLFPKNQNLFLVFHSYLWQ